MLPKSCKKAQLLPPAICHAAGDLKKKALRLVRRMTVVTDTPAGGMPQVRAWRLEWVLEPATHVRRATSPELAEGSKVRRASSRTSS
jgi:hypothetical protein